MAAKAHHQPQPFMEHIYELRRRIAWSVAVVFLGAVIGYLFRTQLINALAQPLHMPLYYTSPSGGFFFVMQVCMLVGGLLALPVLLYNGIRFFEPAFAKSRLSRQRIGVIISVSAALAAAGVAFSYWVVLPASIHFFSLFNVGPVSAWISAKEYLTFATSYLMLMALLFQLPLILLVANSIHRFPPGSIGKWRKWVIVGSFVVAFPLTYDMVSQALMAIPIIILYELSGLIIALVNRKAHKRQAGLAKESRTEVEPKSEPVVAAQMTPHDAVEAVGAVAEAAPIPAPSPLMAERTPQSLDRGRVVQLG